MDGSYINEILEEDYENFTIKELEAKEKEITNNFIEAGRRLKALL